MKARETQLVFRDRLEGLVRLFRPERTLIIYDRKLERAVPGFRQAIGSFPNRYAVKSGEDLKSLQSFPSHVAKLLKLCSTLTPREMTVVAIGGGSVGDFAGFFASVYKRGVRLVHVPTTWLAAIDSSHGGKTALNAGEFKNQIGTFYPADQTVLVRSLLLKQPEDRIIDAMGELGKIALIDGSRWVQQVRLAAQRSKIDGSTLLWRFLKPAIEAKMKVVRRDPFEQRGHRQILSLGHTMGHVFESEIGWSHGYAIAQGLFFAIEYSVHEGILPEAHAEKALEFLALLGLKPERPARPLKAQDVEAALMQDKKRSGQGKVTFIFIRKWGQVERRSISLNALIREARRQGWVGK